MEVGTGTSLLAAVAVISVHCVLCNQASDLCRPTHCFFKLLFFFFFETCAYITLLPFSAIIIYSPLLQSSCLVLVYSHLLRKILVRNFFV